MNNKEIASLLKNIAVYKELSGDNPFKIRAFDQASRMVESYPEDIARIAREDALTQLKGIGKGVSQVIAEYVEKGSSSILEQLRSSFPEDILSLMRIPGLGPKKVKAVWEKLGISTIGELEYACLENRLLTLEGFGEKSQEKILKGIAFKKQFQDVHLFSEAITTAREVQQTLKGSGVFAKVEIAGSLRRGKTVFKDIDILCVPVNEQAVQESKNVLSDLADKDQEVEGVIGAGPTKVSIRRKGIQIDFRIVSERSYPSALQHFTGSKEHNTLLRSRAKKMGLKMNEYGLFSGEEPLSLSTEDEIYERLGLCMIPPEIREGNGEIEAAERKDLPHLVQRSDIRGMIHVHSVHSDGVHSIKTLAEECVKQGYSYLCISDHSKSAFYAHGLSPERLMTQIEEVRRLNEELAPFRIFCGIESDILSDGRLDYTKDVLGHLDFVIGSIHSNLSMSPEGATTRLLNAIHNPYLTILGHISGRLLLSREGYSYDEEKILSALEQELVVLEHNCNPHRLDPDWEFMKKASSRGIIISLGPDAHAIEGFDDIEYGLVMAKKAWISKEGILNSMTGEEIDEFFKRRKTKKGIQNL
jgi:DNA polymerase (family 10)